MDRSLGCACGSPAADDRNRPAADDRNRLAADDRNRPAVDDRNRPDLVGDRNRLVPVDDRNRLVPVDDRNRPVTVDDRNRPVPVGDRNRPAVDGHRRCSAVGGRSLPRYCMCCEGGMPDAAVQYPAVQFRNLLGGIRLPRLAVSCIASQSLCWCMGVADECVDVEIVQAAGGN